MKANSVFNVAAGDESTLAREGSQEVLRATMARRFKNARTINGLGQTEAALKIGWKNATQLSIIEEGRPDAKGRPCPLWALKNASEVYGVSIDYLMGVSDEPERDPKAAERQAVMRSISGVLHATAETILTRVHVHMANGAPSVAMARRFITASDELVQAVTRMYELNRVAFDEDLRGANTVLTKADTLQRILMEVKRQLERHDNVSETVIREALARMGKTHPLLDEPAAGQASMSF
jgi:transcriptional regulator with XRE-family HTH domain